MSPRKVRSQTDQSSSSKNQESKNVSELENDDENLPVTNDYEFREVNPDEISIGYDNDVRDWLLTNKLIDTEYHFRVYKYLNPNHGDRKELVGQWTDYVPSEHEIGISHGGGRYIGILNLTDKAGKRRITSSKFRIHSNYDMMSQQQKVSTMFNPTAGPVMFSGSRSQNNSNGLNDALETIAKMMSIILPAIQAPRGNETTDFSEIMMKNYDMMQSMMKRNLLDNMQLANDLNRRNVGLDEVVDNPDEATGVMGVINQTLPYIEKFLPYITGRSDAQTKATIEAVKLMPQYQKLVKSSGALKGFCAFIDQKHGAEVTDQLLSKFHIKRPIQRVRRNIKSSPAKKTE